MKGMYTCKICGRDFPLLAEEHYVTKEPGRTGVLTALSDVEIKLHDAFDCPHCGCQNLVGVREDLYCGCCEFEDECNGDWGGGDDGSLNEDGEE